MNSKYFASVLPGLAITAFFFSGNLAKAIQPSESTKKPDKPNVPFIAIDDLNDWVGCLGGHPQTHSS